MATMFERVLDLADTATDGGQIPASHFTSAFRMLTGGGMTAAQFKSQFSMTTAQGNELDALMATRPAVPLLLLNVPAWAQWPDRIAGAVEMAGIGIGATTASALRVACGMSP